MASRLLRGRLLAMAAIGVGVSGLGLLLAFWHVHLAGGLRVEPRVRWHDLVRALGGVRAPWLALFALGNVSTLWLRGLQLRALVRRRDGTTPRRYACYQAVAVGMMAQNVLPARLSEAARVLALLRAEDVAAAEATGAVVFGRVLDLAALLAVTCLPSIALGLAVARARAIRVGAAVGAGVALGLVAALAAFYRRRAQVAARAARLRPWLGRLAEGLAAGLSALGSRRRLAAAALTSLAVPLVVAATYGSALYAFGLGGLPAGTALVLVAAILFAIAIPAAPSSVGVFHAVTTWTLVGLGAPAAQAAAFALTTHAIGVVIFIALGGLALAELGGRRLLPRDGAP